MRNGERRSGARSASTKGPDLRALGRRGPVHFVGVAGAGVSALAELVLHAGGRVTGCDLRPGAVGERLAAAGATVYRGHDAGHVDDAVALVATSAVPAHHPELEAARRRGIPVLKRAEALGALVNPGRVIAVAGTHGKTTTTAMTTAILAEAGLDPTAFVGGRVPGWGGGLRTGSDRLFVVEADEYDRSFWTLEPEVAIVTTLEADHVDVYGSVDEVEAAFLRFLEPVPSDGLVVACADDPGARRLLEAVADRPATAYGMGAQATLRAVDPRAEGHGTRFRVEERGVRVGELTVTVPGEHNVRNALAAWAAAQHAGAAFDDAVRALESFQGVARRFEVLGLAADVLVVDDYAHHPTEIEATLGAARRTHGDRRLVAVFQPHLYSRTRAFADAFGRALGRADVIWVTDVYPARETPIPGVTGELVARAAREAGASEVRYEPARDEVAGAVLEGLRPGDLCITLGAGDVDAVGRAVLRALEAREGRGDGPDALGASVEETAAREDRADRAGGGS
ncbi:MAG: UDP-N-acetylmuramate--L-alanine ligase [Gemmatimonadota bacterium]